MLNFLNGHDDQPGTGLKIGRRQLMLTTFFSFTMPAFGAFAANGDYTRFMEISRVLTGFETLDPNQGQHLFEALTRQIPDFHDQLSRLTATDEQTLVQSDLAKPLLTAWYRGTVGSGVHTECIAYLSTLENRLVADILRPPSYAYGAYGTWRSRPQSA